MLCIKGKLYFFTEKESKYARKNDIPTGEISQSFIIRKKGKESYRPCIKINKFQFSAQITVDEDINVIKRGEWYNAELYAIFFTDEAYKKLKSKLKKDRKYFLMEGSQKKGKVILENYEFYDENTTEKIMLKNRKDTNRS